MRLTTQITPRARRWLEPDGPVRLLHRFERVCNLVNAAGEVLSLQLPEMALGPFSWQVTEPVWVGITAEDDLWVANGRLYLGQQALEPKNTSLWDPLPDWAQLKGKKFPLYAVLLPPLLEARFEEWLRALTEGEEELGTAVERLAGLGGGLTPSGDDLLLGSLYALRLRGWESARLARLAEVAADRTTTLSAAFLRAAALGEAVEPWHALCGGAGTAVAQILAIGANSGKEAWMGFTQTLHKRISF